VCGIAHSFDVGRESSEYDGGTDGDDRETGVIRSGDLGIGSATVLAASGEDPHAAGDLTAGSRVGAVNDDVGTDVTPSARRTSGNRRACPAERWDKTSMSSERSPLVTKTAASERGA